jgi:nitrogen-specific signal transduction histidine kinase
LWDCSSSACGGGEPSPKRNATRDELAHLARVASMGEMAASLAHELHQPLGAIMNNAQVAVDLASAGFESRAELKEILQDIVDDDRRAGEIIGRVRELVTKRESQRTRVSMSDILQSVADLMAREAGARQISLEAVNPADPLVVSGDRVQLQQVALNLLQLNSVAADHERIGGIDRFQGDRPRAGLARHEVGHALQDVRHAHARALRLTFGDQLADAADDFASAPIVIHNVLQDLLQLCPRFKPG